MIRRRVIASALAVQMVLVACQGARAQDPAATQADVWSLKLGTPASALPVDDFIDYACGTNGGPPGRVIEGWTEFGRCPADARGLHEVYFRYDDELEYWARAIDNPGLIARYEGTRVSVFHVIVSLLFDNAGEVDGVRIATDPRIEPQQRQSAYGMGRLMMARFDSQGWACTDLPRLDGESGLAGTFIKQRCEKSLPDRDLIVWTSLYQKAGQSVVDQFTAETRQGQFESSARLEMYRRR